ncbi:hypothetical protein PHYPSEUDO_004101 [Phytophthora pseudosyringae]|uniref:Uncharacterized protein n=1 Tax=Phytophthora pseudosyringae TaxID=221518 RepID=A0A8T1WIS9_9STRA|nr:hypothetical protein PHYPSEUDO_004101 [Phytophthora pseudosyringae]
MAPRGVLRAASVLPRLYRGFSPVASWCCAAAIASCRCAVRAFASACAESWGLGRCGAFLSRASQRAAFAPCQGSERTFPHDDGERRSSKLLVVRTLLIELRERLYAARRNHSVPRARGAYNAFAIVADVAVEVNNTAQEGAYALGGVESNARQLLVPTGH